MLGSNPAGAKQLQELLVRIINLSVPLAFIALTIMLLYGGYKFLTSGGDQKSVQAARNLLQWSILGIVFMIVAWIILRVIQAFTGVDVTHFCIGFPGGPNNCQF